MFLCVSDSYTDRITSEKNVIQKDDLYCEFNTQKIQIQYIVFLKMRSLTSEKNILIQKIFVFQNEVI